MKNYKIQLGKNIITTLLLLALMLPSAIQFFHIFEAHEHTICNDKSTHIHETIPDCSICSFHQVIFNYDLDLYPNLFLPKLPVKIDENLQSLQLHSFKIINIQLRAPPIFS